MKNIRSERSAFVLANQAGGRLAFTAMMVRAPFVACCVVFLLLWGRSVWGQQPTEPRLALIMGVSDYSDTKFPSLPGIDKDLDRMEKALKATGFEVTVVFNPTLNMAEDAVTAFGAKLKAQPKGVGLFYFSGHGGEFDGKNYLIPKGARIASLRDIRQEAMAAQRVLNQMEDAGAQVNIVFLDCCRNDLTKAATDSGLAPMSAKGTFIGFATGTDKTSAASSDGSPYTEILAKRILTPGVSILDMHTQVTADVEDYTKSFGAEQTPFQYSGLRSTFYFVPPQEGGDSGHAHYAPVAPIEMARLATPAPVPPEIPKVEPVLPATTSGSPPEKATKAKPFVNSLRMPFVPVPGTKVLFCRYHTRVSDWQAFVREAGDPTSGGMLSMYTIPSLPGYCIPQWQLNAGLSWKNPGFVQTPNDPVVGTSWEDDHLFCAWLSKKEGRKYRLPTDAEWTAAVAGEKYPWGKDWPPPKGAGNYADDSLIHTLPGKSWQVPGDDGYAHTSPVGRFGPNRYGIYDIGGNAWQPCEDDYRPSMNDAATLNQFPFLKAETNIDGTPLHVARGCSWCDSFALALKSNSRFFLISGLRGDNTGFRVVLDLSGN